MVTHGGGMLVEYKSLYTHTQTCKDTHELHTKSCYVPYRASMKEAVANILVYWWLIYWWGRDVHPCRA